VDVVDEASSTGLVVAVVVLQRDLDLDTVGLSADGVCGVK
jgi:hypothetical protein